MATIKEQLLQHIAGWDHIWGQDRWDDALFNQLASQVFSYQFEHNAPYRQFCQGRGIEQIDRYDQAPAVPTDVFKLVSLTTTDSPSMIFQTSGTTVGQRGKHMMLDTQVYEASLLGPFMRYCMPDVRSRQILSLHPSHKDLPSSSLSFMIDRVIDAYGTAPSAHYVELDEQGQWQWALSRFQQDLQVAIDVDEPIIVLGTAFGFMHVLDTLDQTWSLPAGSVLMETGGFKGRSRELSKPEMYTLFAERFGVEAVRCVSEYSMTELSAQAYSNNVHQLILNEKRLDLSNRRFKTPPWARVVAVDPLSLKVKHATTEPVEGLLCWFDLSNLYSVMAVQTSDMGVVEPDGRFELLGRAQDAQLRGCSLTIEEITEHQP